MDIGHFYDYLLTRHDVSQLYFHDIPSRRVVVPSEAHSSSLLIMLLKLFLCLFLRFHDSLCILSPKTHLEVMDSCLRVHREDVLNCQYLFRGISIDLFQLKEGKTVTQFDIIFESFEREFDFLIAGPFFWWEQPIASSLSFRLVCHW